MQEQLNNCIRHHQQINRWGLYQVTELKFHLLFWLGNSKTSFYFSDTWIN
jgi:hypothetical protein